MGGKLWRYIGGAENGRITKIAEIAGRRTSMCILYNKRDAPYIMFFIIISALRVSDGFSAHHQELIKLYCSPGCCHVFLLSTPTTPAVDSRKA